MVFVLKTVLENRFYKEHRFGVYVNCSSSLNLVFFIFFKTKKKREPKVFSIFSLFSFFITKKKVLKNCNEIGLKILLSTYNPEFVDCNVK